MDPAVTALGEHYQLLYGDVTQPVVSWVPALSTAEVDNTSPAPPVGTDSKFDFVNGGAVQDHAQRLTTPVAGVLTCEEAVTGDTDADRTAILPWLTLFIPQLQVALQHVVEGGSMMLVYGAPHCASLMILLRAMEPLLTGSEPTALSSPSAVTIMETMHLVKPPVYVLLQGLRVTIAQQGHITRLLEALSPTSDVVNPLTGEVRVFVSAEARREAKERYWLGESDEGFEAAVEGFAHHRDSLEVVWDKAKDCLTWRRERAERQQAPHRGGSKRSVVEMTGILARGSPPIDVGTTPTTE